MSFPGPGGVNLVADSDPGSFSSQQNNRVRVEDALSYLDQVKHQFANEPNVYTQFLDIMKDFKSQTIDTPGVIRRVSQLFRGTPSLILGFNTFLPPGFRVHISDNRITISEPSGNIQVITEDRAALANAPRGLILSPVVPSGANSSGQHGQVHIPQQSAVEVPRDSRDVVMPRQSQQELPPQQQQPVPLNNDVTEISSSTVLTSTSSTSIRSMRAASELSLRSQQVAVQMSTQSQQQQQPMTAMSSIILPAAQSASQPSHKATPTVAERKAASQASSQMQSPLHSSDSLQPPLSGALSQSDQPPGQNPGFNQALGYVNKIKVRFAKKPFVYKQFLDILTNYQNQIQQAKSNTAPCERYILDAIGTLFASEQDLLDEFRFFLPEATMMASRSLEQEDSGDEEGEEECEELEISSSESSADEENEEEEGRAEKSDNEEEEEESVQMEDEQRVLRSRRGRGAESAQRKRVLTTRPKSGGGSPAKRPRAARSSLWKREVELSKIADKLEPDEIATFEKIKRALTPKRYKNFCRGLNLYSSKLINEEEMHAFIRQVLGGVLPNVVNWFGQKLGISVERTEGDDRRVVSGPRINSELAHEIDYNSCKQLGVSYRSLPDSYKRPMCSGRTALCREVLNDTWVSFPSWSSEDSSNVSSKKSIFEEYVYRTEDDRFELDIILEVNKYAIDALDGVMKSMKKKKPYEIEMFRLDDSLGATSPSIMQRAIKRVYGEASFKVIEGLKKNPFGSIPRLLERLRQKHAEWTDAQRQMNVIWRDAGEKYMARSMDHQSNSAKVLDAKWMKSKTLVLHIERLFDERQRRSVLGEVPDEGPHMILMYPRDRSIVHDVNDLLLHHIRRQTSMQKEEKEKVKRVVRHWIPEWFGIDREGESDEEEEMVDGKRRTRQTVLSSKMEKEKEKEMQSIVTLDESGEREDRKEESTYRMIYGANPLFVLLRLHGMVCERLGKLKKKCREMVDEYMLEDEIAQKREQYYKKYGKGLMTIDAPSVIDNSFDMFRTPRVNPNRHYAAALVEVKGLIDGQTEQTIYEENIRALFPTDLQYLVMMDKFVGQMCKQIHLLVNEDEPFRSLETYEKYRFNSAPKLYEIDDNRVRIETEYAEYSERKLNCHNCFRVIITHDVQDPVVSIELVDTENDIEEVDAERERRQAERKMREEARRRIREEYMGDYVPVRSGPLFRRRHCSSGRRPTEDKKDVPNGVDVPMDVDGEEKRGESVVEEESVKKQEMIRLSPYSPSINPNFTLHCRKNRPTREKRIDSLHRMTSIRRDRASIMDSNNEEECSTTTQWLMDGLKKVPVYNPEYPFLLYNRYVSTSTVTSSTSNTLSTGSSTPSDTVPVTTVPTSTCL